MTYFVKRWVMTTKLLCLIAALSISTGCMTTPTGERRINPATAQSLAPILTSSVAGAVVYAYTRDRNAEKYLAVLRTGLQEFMVSDDLSAGALQARLYSLPIKELKTPEAQLIIAPLLGAYRTFADQKLKEGIKKDEGLVRLVNALIAGLDEGLNAINAIKSNQPATTTVTGPEEWRDGFTMVVETMVKQLENSAYPSGG